MLRPGDTVARFGGDEFTVLCEDLPTATSRDRAIEIAQRLLDVGRRSRSSCGGAETFVSASVGIALATGEERPEELLRDADAAMYHAKESGRGPRRGVRRHDARPRRSRATRPRTRCTARSSAASCSLFFQPVISLARRAM